MNSRLLQRMSARRRSTAQRRGFSLVEVMVAMVILGVGVLGLAGLSVVAGAQWRGASAQYTASLVVQSRFDSLASIPCQLLAPSGPQSGTATTMGVTEKWWVRDGNDIKTIIDTVRFSSRRNPLAYTSIVPCRD